MFGIHCTKRADHPELKQWARHSSVHDEFLVRCALSGTVVETEQGFRAQHAMITNVFIGQHWITYQEYEYGNWKNRPYYQERTYTHPSDYTKPFKSPPFSVWKARYNDPNSLP